MQLTPQQEFIEALEGKKRGLKPEKECPSYEQYMAACADWHALIKLHQELGDKRKKQMAKVQTLREILALERRL